MVRIGVDVVLNNVLSHLLLFLRMNFLAFRGPWVIIHLIHTVFVRFQQFLFCLINFDSVGQQIPNLTFFVLFIEILLTNLLHISLLEQVLVLELLFSVFYLRAAFLVIILHYWQVNLVFMNIAVVSVVNARSPRAEHKVQHRQPVLGVKGHLRLTVVGERHFRDRTLRIHRYAKESVLRICVEVAAEFRIVFIQALPCTLD